MIKSDRMSRLQVPQYEVLALDDVMAFADQHQEVYRYLPDKIEVRKCPKQWIVNVIYTIVKDDFGQWVKEQIEERNIKVAIEKDLMIDMDPEIAEAFAASTAVSTSKGIGANMLKVSGAIIIFSTPDH